MILTEWMPAAFGLAFLGWFPAAFAFAAMRAGQRGGAKDRRALLSGAATAALGLAFARTLVPWDVVPPVVWGVAATITAWGVLASVWAWPALPLVAASRPRLRLAGTAASLAATAVAIALIV